MATARSEDMTLDLWMALAAGEGAWAEPDTPVSSHLMTSLWIELAALALAVAFAWLSYVDRVPPPTSLARLAPELVTVFAAMLSIRPAFALLGKPRRSTNTTASLIARAIGLTLTIAGLLANAPPHASFLVAVVGVAAGAEAVRAAWAIGAWVNPVRWWLHFMRSPVHFGIIGAVAALVVGGFDSQSLRTTLQVYGVVQVTLVAACVTGWVLEQIRRRSACELAEIRRDTELTEHRKRAHWVHDELCADVRLISLRIQRQQASPTQIIDLLDELEHQLRLEQLDQLFMSGRIRLADIIQPYVRRAQNHGIVISEVPTFDDAALLVLPDAGRLFARAAAITTSNAMNAGATEVGFRIYHDDGHVTLTVTDNAGGFDLLDLHTGRGLWSLRQELGQESIRALRTDVGTELSVTIPVTERGIG